MSGVRSCCRDLISLGDYSRRDAATLGVPALCHCWSPPLLIVPPVNLSHLVFLKALPIFPPAPLMAWSRCCVWQCISALITAVRKAPFSGRTGQRGGERCFLHHQQADPLPAAPLLIFPPLGGLMLVRAAAACFSSAAVWYQEQCIPPTAHLKLLGGFFACGCTSPLHFQQ